MPLTSRSARQPSHICDHAVLFFLLVGIPIGELLFTHFIVFSDEVMNFSFLSGKPIVWVVVASKLFSIVGVVLLLCLLCKDPGYTSDTDETSVTHRCSVCDRNVVDFDHHCKVLGVCVGRGNYRYFVIFLNIATLLSVLVFAVSLVSLLVFCSRMDRSNLPSSVFDTSKFSSFVDSHPIACAIFMSITFYTTLFCGILSLYYNYVSCRGTYSHKRRKHAPLRGDCLQMLTGSLPSPSITLFSTELTDTAALNEK